MERYVHNRLSETEQAAFEEHLLACDACVEELTRLGALRAELARRRGAIEAAAEPRRLPGRAIWLPVAAVLLLGLGLVLLLEPWSAGGIASLAEIEPPAYEAPQLRVSASVAEEGFRAAIEPYVQGRYRDAILALEKLEPRTARIDFYLGACYLLTDQPDPAIETLGRVVEMGDLQYLEEALYLRAQAHLLRDEADVAARDLRSIIELEGDWQSRAMSQLERLEDWQRGES